MPEPTDVRGELARWGESTPACRLVVLFGSAATGRTWSGSDVDVALCLDPVPPPTERLRIIGEIQDRSGPRRADVVFLRPETDPVLRFEIFRDGLPLYEAEPGLFTRERVRAVKLYQDALPFRRALIESVGGGS